MKPKMKIALITLAACLLTAFAAPAHAKYRATSLHDLVAASDLAAVGTITALTSESYTFEIEEQLYGEPVEGSVTVKRFVDWTCAQRWEPYAVGQRLLLFADRTDLAYARIEGVKPPETEYVVRSGGGEGEMPIVGGEVVVRKYGDIGLGVPTAATSPGQLHGARVPLERWKTAIATFRTLYTLERRYDAGGWRSAVRARRVGKATDFAAARAEPLVVNLIKWAKGAR